MDARIVDDVVDRELCERVVYDINAMAVQYRPMWHPGKGHIANHMPFPELVEALQHSLGIPEPDQQMGILDPPGCRGIRAHGHDSDAILFYPRTHSLPLCLDPPWWVDVRAGRVVFVPRKLRHSVMTNNSSIDRYCVAMLFE